MYRAAYRVRVRAVAIASLLATLLIGVSAKHANAETIPINSKVPGDRVAAIMQAEVSGRSLSHEKQHGRMELKIVVSDVTVTSGDLLISGSGDRVNGEFVRGRVIVATVAPITFKGDLRGHDWKGSAMNTPVVASLSTFKATADMEKGSADIEVPLRIRTTADFFPATAAHHRRTSPLSRMTFRMNAYIRPMDVTALVKLQVKPSQDGRGAIVTLTDWRAADPNQQIEAKLSGQNLPDGILTIKPIDAAKGSAKIRHIDRFSVPNPIVGWLEGIKGRKFEIGP